jgi:phage repressor protein C with HTH and peptisase S24 domain
MEPKIKNRDLIIVEKSSYADFGQMIVGIFEERPFVKIYNEYKKNFISLESLNPDFKPMIARPDEVIIE